MSDKIRSSHLERKAIVYLRQSSLHQVREHRESTKRQYALRERAGALGWSADAIEVIDEDLGHSSLESRPGFQHVAEEVAKGRVGALFALEVSRLARSSADWYRLLDLVGLAGAVLVDEEFVYDPGDFNDRLVLGLKGQFADAELYWMRLRLHGGKMSKARRGEIVFGPPTGYVWGDAQRLRFDPDEQVQRVVRLLFERFRLDGSAAAVVRYLDRHGVRLPLRDKGSGEIRWQPVRYHRVLQVLRNPLYSGAYVYGRRQTRTALVDGEVRRKRTTELPVESWQVCLRDHHPAYVSWDEFMANQKKLADNWTAGRPKQPDLRGAAREGKALLQGLVLCGRCGQRMYTRYFGSKRYSHYVCRGAKFKEGGALTECWIVSAKSIDEAVGDLFLGVLQPEELDLSLAVTRDAERQASEIERQWQLQLEHARYAARMAERRYKAVDPDYRPVARTLEREWNDKLEELARLEREYEAVRQREKVVLTDDDRRHVLALARDLPKVWNARTTTMAERKNLLRMLIREVALSPIEAPDRTTRAQVLWVTGAVTELEVSRPGPGSAMRTPKESVEAIRKLYRKGYTDAAIVAEMNRLRLPSGWRRTWTVASVRWVRSQHGMPKLSGTKRPRAPSRRKGNLYSTEGVAKLLRMPVPRVWAWVRQGHLRPVEGGPGRPLWFRLEPADVKQLRALRAERRARGYGGPRRKHESQPMDKVHCV
jgi:DNA invertase Pin-like site-specific DNA recombinase